MKGRSATATTTATTTATPATGATRPDDHSARLAYRTIVTALAATALAVTSPAASQRTK